MKGDWKMKLHHLLAVLPFIGVLICAPFVNTVKPYVFGLPFVIFWMVMWVVLTSIIMWIVYKIDPANRESESQ
jgi:pilus assembly protein TadC